MGLIVYECQRADHGHEICQFVDAANVLYEYFNGRDELAIFIGNVNIGDINLDGLIIKDDAIIIVEFKSYEGNIVATQNGHWMFNGKEPIKGGSGGKTVFEQLRENRRNLRNSISSNKYFSNNKIQDIKGLVVFSKIHSCENYLDSSNKMWVFISDIKGIGDTMHDIKSRPFKNKEKQRQEDVCILDEEKFEFLRKFHIQESALMTRYSDVHLLPKDLYDEKNPHNGKIYSPGTELEILQGKNDALEKENEELKKQPEEKLEENGSSKRRFGLKERVLKEFNVKEDDLDKEQKRIINKIDENLDESMIVSGCAGSGKSVIAMYKAQQIIDEGGDVIIIALTKSLNRYMSQGKDIKCDRKIFYYHHEWLDAGKPKADYMIVDEIQDFTEEQVREFLEATQKHFFFFGDTAQSIYNGIDGKKRITLKEVSDLTKELSKHDSKIHGIDLLYLNSNYRLPKPIAKITQDYVAVDASEYVDSIYKSTEKELPYLLRFVDEKSQIEAIVNIIEKKKMKNVGILLPNNDCVMSLIESFRDISFDCEYKYNIDGGKTEDNLDFRTNKPKVMTYHSAKGLQFETVILPFYDGAMNKNDKKALYVAMTRSYRFLYIMCSGDELKEPLKSVPTHLYTTKL